jgi:hypothetical protein
MFATRSLISITSVSSAVEANAPSAETDPVLDVVGKGMKYENISKLITHLESTFSEQG